MKDIRDALAAVQQKLSELPASNIPEVQANAGEIKSHVQQAHTWADRCVVAEDREQQPKEQDNGQSQDQANQG